MTMRAISETLRDLKILDNAIPRTDDESGNILPYDFQLDDTDQIKYYAELQISACPA